MSAQSTFSTTKAPINWRLVRPLVGVAFFACEIALRAVPEEHRQIIGIVEVSFFLSVCAASTLLAYQSSRSFGSGQTARRVWIIIALMPLADAFAYFSYNFPAYTSGHHRSKELIAISTILLSLSRVL